jgi:hypothetical protein
VGTAQDYRLVCRMRGHTTGSGEWFLEEPSFIGAARVRQNWFLLSLILAPCCPTGRGVSSGKSGQFQSGSFNCFPFHAPGSGSCGAGGAHRLTFQ